MLVFLMKRVFLQPCVGGSFLTSGFCNSTMKCTMKMTLVHLVSLLIQKFIQAVIYFWIKWQNGGVWVSV